MYIYYSISYEFAVLIIQNTCHEGIEMFRKDENDITSGDIQDKKETAELEYASLYDDDQAPTEEEQKQLQAEHEENERLEKKQILQQRMIKYLAVCVIIVFAAIVIGAYMSYQKKSEIDPSAVAAASESSSAALSTQAVADTSDSVVLISAADTSASGAFGSSALSDAASSASTGIAPGISNGDYHIYDPNADYKKVNETVTSYGKSVNLRTAPSLNEDSEIIGSITQDQTITRTAIGENGWSKVSYNGVTAYAVTSLLKTADASTSATSQSAVTGQSSQEATQDVSVQDSAAVAAATAVATAAPAKTTAKKSVSKSSASYYVELSSDSKKSTIWSGGKKLGTMNITNADGNAQVMQIYDSYYYDKEGKKYLNIYVKGSNQSFTINTDDGYADAMRAMDCSGICLNKSIHSW